MHLLSWVSLTLELEELSMMTCVLPRRKCIQVALLTMLTEQEYEGPRATNCMFWLLVPTWKILYSFNLPLNRNTIPNACKAHRTKELLTKWIVTVCLQRTPYTKPAFYTSNECIPQSRSCLCCLWLRDIELELHGNESPGHKLSPAGSTADSTVTLWVNTIGQMILAPFTRLSSAHAGSVPP